jgi:hypothetical protein
MYGTLRKFEERPRSGSAANVDFVESEAESLPFTDGCFGVVVSNGVIDQIPDEDAVFTHGGLTVTAGLGPSPLFGPGPERVC